MKYINIINLFTLLVLCSVNINAQSNKKKTQVPVKFQLVDSNGNPLKGAEIIVGEGVKHIDTDKNGMATFNMDMNDIVTISSHGYVTKTMQYPTLNGKDKVELSKALYMASKDDVVNLPFSKTNYRSQTGDNIVISGEELRRYPSLDFRNALTALVPGLIVSENDGSTGVSSGKVSLSVRGGAPMYFLDEVPIDILQFTVNPLEVESVTIVKDVVDKAKFGPRAANGIVYIKTIRGKKNERQLNVNIEKGVQNVDRMPGVASGADYALLNNMARTNSGMQPLYSDEAIEAYKTNDPSNLKYPSNNFQDLMFKDLKSYDKYSISTLGGNDFAQYYANLAYTGEGDNFKIGRNANFNNITFRSNVDIKLNDIVSVNAGVFGGLTIRNSARYSSTDVNDLEYTAALLASRQVSPVAFPIYLPIETKGDIPVYGVSEAFPSNPVANLAGGGYYEERGRTGSVYSTVNFDLSKITKGLSVKANINFTTYNMTRVGKKNEFDSRTIVFADNVNTFENSYVSKTFYSVPGSESKLSDQYYQNLAGYGQLSYARTFGDHSVSGDAVYFLSSLTKKGVKDPYKEQNINVFGSYGFKDRYYLNGSVSYSGSQALIGKNRYKAFPSVGAAWILSDEKFMKDVTLLNYLKIRCQYGQLGYTTSSPSLRQYENQWVTNTGTTFGPATTSAWQGAQGTMTSGNTYYGKWKNPDIDWQIREEFTVGIDASLFKNKLNLSAEYYDSKHKNIQGTADYQYPLMSGLLANPTINYESTDYYGTQFSASYTDKINDFRYSIAASATLNKTKRLKYDEQNYRDSESYLRRNGQSTDVIYGYVYDGKFATDEEAQNVVQYNDDKLIAGDFKYKDINGDGILDSKDQVVIGNSAPKVYYTLNIGLYYKNFELHTTADGKAGFDMVMNNDYYRDGCGDNNYSQYIVDKVNAGDYPRLTYTKINNNFLTSSYWLQKRDYFKIQNVELAYNIRFNAKSKNAIRNIRLFARGANLLTVSNVKGIDPESPNAGITTYPLNKTYTFGLSLTL